MTLKPHHEVGQIKVCPILRSSRNQELEHEQHVQCQNKAAVDHMSQSNKHNKNSLLFFSSIGAHSKPSAYT